MSRLVLSEVRIMYPQVFEAKSIPGSNSAPKFSLVAVLPTMDDVKPVLAKLHAAAVEKHGKKFADAMVKAFKGGGKNPANHFPIRRCDEKGEKEDALFRVCPDGWWARFQANEQFPPTVVDRQANPVMDQKMIYSGCVGNVDWNTYAWSHPTGGKGVSLGLNALQFVADGERVGGGGGHSFGKLDGDDEEEGFGDDGDDGLDDLLADA